MFVIQFSSLNDLRNFKRAHSLFVLWYPHSKKSQKRRQKITFFIVVLLYVNVVFFCFVVLYIYIYIYITTSKWLKVLKLSKLCLKMVKAMTLKTNDQNILVLHERLPFNLHCIFNECGIKLLILINNYP